LFFDPFHLILKAIIIVQGTGQTPYFRYCKKGTFIPGKGSNPLERFFSGKTA